MTRLRARLFALAFAGWAGFANAAALGEIEVTSHLNQALAATIPVATTKPGEMEGATVELAGNDEFERAGMERTEFLSALRFEIKDGYIKVTSKQIAREPFVSFLLDVRWIGGHLLREYTVLLDPVTGPSTSTRPKAVVVPPTTPDAAPQPSEAPDAGTAPAQSQMAPAPSDTPTPMAANGGSYGPTSPQETLWSIAYKLRPDPALTMDQMQVAIYKANPSAFDHGRLTGLMKGVTLRVPTADEIRAVDAAAAKAQVAAARNGGSMPAPTPRKSAATKPAKAPQAVPATKPRAEAPAAETAPVVAEAPAPTPEPKVEAKAEPAPQAAPPASVPPPASTLSEAKPEIAPTPTLTPAPAAEPTPAPAPVVAEAPKPAIKTSAPTPGLVGDLVDRGKGLVDAPWFLPAAAGFVLVILGLLGYRKIGEAYAKWAYERASRKAAAPKKPTETRDADADATQVAREAMSESEQQAAEAVTQMSPQIAATQVMAAQTMQQTFQQTQIQEPPLATTGGQKVDFDVTGNFANETVQINLDAGDPVSEAEFHRAYGLYDEAALLLKQALQKDPARIDARVKLAEIYFEASKANEFVDVAKELKAQLPDAEWQKIALLGTQIAPSHELFAGGATATGAVDLSFDEFSAPAAPVAAPMAAPSPAPVAASEAPLEFSFDEVQLDTPAVAEPVVAEPVAGGLEFDLGNLSIDTPTATPAAPVSVAAPPAPAGGELNLSDFDLGSETPGDSEMLELGGDLTADPNAGGDESSTKLDLARAYIDMGDNDMAKSLLNEVAQQGNPQQKSEAQELLKRVPA